MDETRLGEPLTPEAQALRLLDHPQGKEHRQQPELFSSPDFFVNRSFVSQEIKEAEPEKKAGFSFSMAARLSSDRYEERAKADALYQALKTLQQRNRSFGSGKVIRAK